MSTRQRRRARGSEQAIGKRAPYAAGAEEDGLADNAEQDRSDSDSEEHPPAAPRFAFSDDSSSDSEEGDDHQQPNDAPEWTYGAEESEAGSPSRKQKSQSEQQPLQEQDEGQLLEALIEANRALAEASSASVDTPFDAQLEVSSRQLDLDLSLRNQFLDQVDDGKNDNHDAHRSAPKGRHRALGLKRTATRRFLFSVPKMDWKKPPSFVAGGMSMVKVWEDGHQALFRFQWSPDYRILDQRFQMVKEAGDANLLVMFLANHPHHAEGLLTLGQLFAKMGRIDRATDLIRRALHYHECVFMESFKPFSGKCRLDASVKENRVFLHALYRYTLLCASQHHMALASNLALMLLSLDPFDQNHCILLQLDHLLLSCNRFSSLQRLCGLSDLEPEEEEALSLDHWKRCFWIQGRASLEHLPNWWYSLALSVFLLAERQDQPREAIQKKKAITSSSGSPSSPVFATKAVANRLLCQAIRRWPCMLMALYSEVAASSPILRALSGNAFFATAIERIPQSSALHVIRSCYLARQAPLWKSRPELLQWLSDCAHQVHCETLQSSSQTTALSSEWSAQDKAREDEEREVHNLPELQRYALASKEDFLDEGGRLPDGVQPIEDDLMDEQLLAGNARFPLLETYLNNHQVRLLAQKDDLRDVFPKSEAGESTVDLNRPLLQLFFLTILPWIRLPRFYQ